jgi:hypothetical protein
MPVRGDTRAGAVREGALRGPFFVGPSGRRGCAPADTRPQFRCPASEPVVYRIDPSQEAFVKRTFALALLLAAGCNARPAPEKPSPPAVVAAAPAAVAPAPAEPEKPVVIDDALVSRYLAAENTIVRDLEKWVAETKADLTETKVYVDPPGWGASVGHAFSRRVDPKTLERVDSPEQIDSWNRTWTFFDWWLRPYEDRSKPAPVFRVQP